MKSNIISMLRLILLLCFFPLFTAQAQKKPSRSCRIIFLKGPDAAPNTLHLFDGASSREVDLPRMNLSKIYELPTGPLTLHMLAKPLADPADLPPKAPQASVAESILDFYLLVTSDPANTVAPVRLQVINANFDQLKAGQMLWYNLTDHAIGGKVGSQSFALKPQSREIMNAPALKNEGYDVDIRFRIKGSDALYPLCETQWHHDPSSRSLAFVINEPGVRTPRIVVFPDYRHKPTEEP